MAIEPASISTQQYNEHIASWATSTGNKIRVSIASKEQHGKGKLLSSFRTKTDKNGDEIDRIAYTFERHGVFWHKGVGRGYVMSGGRVMRGMRPGTQTVAYARKKNRSVKAIILTGPVNRKAVEWFNPIVAGNIQNLADMVTEMRADQSVNGTKILIK